jgi:hypothetical protein
MFFFANGMTNAQLAALVGRQPNGFCEKPVLSYSTPFASALRLPRLSYRRREDNPDYPYGAADGRRPNRDTRWFRAMHNRYQSVNLLNANTVELRCFRGTLSYEGVMRDLDFTDALVHWLPAASVSGLTWPKFVDFVTTAEGRNRWPFLAAFYQADGTLQRPGARSTKALLPERVMADGTEAALSDDGDEPERDGSQPGPDDDDEPMTDADDEPMTDAEVRAGRVVGRAPMTDAEVREAGRLIDRALRRERPTSTSSSSPFTWSWATAANTTTGSPIFRAIADGEFDDDDNR